MSTLQATNLKHTSSASNNIVLDASGNAAIAGNLSFNSGFGSAGLSYGCRAWVNFNGTGTVAIRASGNVSSIGDLGTGWYQVNFTNSMPDANYVVAGACGTNSSRVFSQWGTISASLVQVNTTLSNTTAGEDQTHVYVAIFR